MLLHTQSLEYAYRAGGPLRFPDVGLEAGGSLLITGESGSGKTTLLHLIAGLLCPSSGVLRWKGQDRSALSSAALDRWRGTQLGLVFQQAHFVRSLSVWDNWRAAAWCAGLPVDAQRLRELAGRMDLSALLHRRVDRLSTGEQQRAAIGRALVNRPALLLADEPSSALDDRRCEQVLDLLRREAAADGAALIIVTHDARVKAHFDRVLTIERVTA